MQIETLQVFCDLVETSSFSEAAKRNDITQSAVSQQIRSLETKYEVVFFERGKKNFAVTPEGEIFYDSARRTLEVYNGIGDQLNALQDRIAGQLRIATIGSIGFHDLPPRVELFRERFPEVDLVVDYKHANAVYDEVLEGRADLGLVAYPTTQPGIMNEVFSKERLVLACAPTHPLAGRKRIKVSDLAAHELIAFEPDQPTRRSIDRLFRTSGVRVETHLEFDNVETVKRALIVTEGMSIMPESSIQGEVKSGRISSARIEGGDDFWRPLGVLRRRASTTTQAMREFINLLKEEGTR